MTKEIIGLIKIIVICFTAGYTLHFAKPYLSKPRPAVPDEKIEATIKKCMLEKRKVVIVSDRNDNVTSIFCKPLKLEVIKNFFSKD